MSKKSFWRSGTISLITIISFVAVLVIILVSNLYMNACVENEAEANQRRNELKALGDSLANASDLLTDEVRRFAVTGNIEHLYNYWHEARATKQRDMAIDKLISYNPPQSELELLEEAKKYSDILIETETYSMKLVLLSKGITAEDYADNAETFGYVQYVLSYDLPDEYKTLSQGETERTAVQILYDDDYEYAKYLIMKPIEDFQMQMNTRLDTEVNESTEGRLFASRIQILSLLIAVAFIAALLVMINLLYIVPLKKYSAQLSGSGWIKGLEKIDFKSISVVPTGAYELKEFGGLFNTLSSHLHKEFLSREKAEEKMRLARDEANRANNAKSEFLARMSHELRTPLNAIIGYIYLLSQTKPDENQSRYIKSTSLASENLLGLISNILDFSKIESGKLDFEFAPFKPVDVIKEVCSVMENSALQKGLSFSVDVDEKIPEMLIGDSVKLRQILTNLVGNAVKFTHEGGICVFAAAEKTKSESCIILFKVTDTGIGISSDEKNRIFKPFVQADAGITRHYGGTGLGLSICKMIIELLSGGKETLNLESAPGKGSAFSFRIAFGLCDSKPLPKDEGIDDFSAICAGKELLLIDDNEINLEVESEIIKAMGIGVTLAQSGGEALSALKKYRFDIIITDIRMPDMDGFELLGRIRNISGYASAPIIALSADVLAGVEETALSAGANHYAAKPLKPRLLRKLIGEYLSISESNPQSLYRGGEVLFNISQCLNNLSGNQSALTSLVKRFVIVHSESGKHIVSHAEAGYFQNAAYILHDIIGISGNLCCKRLCDTARRLYTELNAGKTNSLEDFSAVWESTVSELKAYISAQETANEGKTVNTDDFQPALVAFKEKCASLDTAAVDDFERLSPIFKANMTDEEFKRLAARIEGFDFMGALALLEKEEQNV